MPLCSEDVRLPSWDCPHPRRVEVPGKCCPEWVCDPQPLPARGEYSAGRGRGGGGLLGEGHLDTSKPRFCGPKLGGDGD